MVSDNVILTVIGVFVAIIGAVGHLYSMIFDLRKQVREEMSERMAEINRQIVVLQTMLQSDRQLREETRVATERELGRTVKHDDLQRATDRLLGEIRDVKSIAGGRDFHRGPTRS